MGKEMFRTVVGITDLTRFPNGFTKEEFLLVWKGNGTITRIPPEESRLYILLFHIKRFVKNQYIR